MGSETIEHWLSSPRSLQRGTDSQQYIFTEDKIFSDKRGRGIGKQWRLSSITTITCEACKLSDPRGIYA